MSNTSTTCSDPILRNAKVPWVTFVFLAIVFFVAQHDLVFSIKSMGVFNPPMEEITTRGAWGGLSYRALRRPIAFSLLGVFGAIALMRQRRNRLRINGFLGWLILLFLAWEFFSLAWTESAVQTFRALVAFAMLSLGALCVAAWFSLRKIVLLTFFITILYLVIGFLAEIALGTFHPFAPGYRFAGTVHPNAQGLNCALLLLSGVGAAQTAKRGGKLFLACALIGLVFLVLTGSRTAFGSAFLALFAYWSLVSSGSHKLTSILGVSFTFCLLLLLFGDAFFLALRQCLLLRRVDDFFEIPTLTGRILLWKECLVYVGKHPILGYGYNGFWTPRHIREISAGQGLAVGEGHSAYLDLLLNLGPLGMVAYVLIMVVGIRRSSVYYRASLNTAYAFCGALLMFSILYGLLESGVLHPAPLMFLNMVALVRLGFQCPYTYQCRSMPTTAEHKGDYST